VPTDLSSFLYGVLTSGVLSAVVTYRLTLSSGRIERRNDLRGFLGRWLTDIERVRANDAEATYAAYIANIEHFGGYAAKLQRDFIRRRKLQRLCKDLRHLLPEHINNDTGDCREIVANRIQALIDFV